MRSGCGSSVAQLCRRKVTSVDNRFMHSSITPRYSPQPSACGDQHFVRAFQTQKMLALRKHLDDEVIVSHLAIPHEASHRGDRLVSGVILCSGTVVAILLAHLVHLHGHAILAITRKTGCCPSRCAIFWGTERQRSCVPVYTTGGDRGAGHANPVG